MDAHGDYAVDCLEICAWGISETIRTLAGCPHTSRRLTGKVPSQLCGLCLSIQTRLGLISTHLESDPDAASNPEVQQQAFNLLGILENLCSRTRPSTIPSEPQQPAKEHFVSLCNLVQDEMRKDYLRRSVLAYLKNPSFVLEPLNKCCQNLLGLLQTEDSEDDIERAEPEDHSRAHKSLFPVLREYTICDSCALPQHTKNTCSRHPTRLYLMDATKSEDGLVRFDVIISAADESWQDLGIEISATTGQRVTFVSEVSHPSPTPIQETPERLHRFCQVFQHDDGCRISLKLQDGSLFRLGVEALKHRLSQGKGISLADVLEHYTLSIREKFALSHVISSAFWQFYNSPLMYRAWSSHTVWFMPEPDLRDDSERLPLRVYISFHPEITECEFDAFEFVQQLPLVHRCPRIQSLAILLLEIGLGKPFRCRSFDRHVLNLNYRYSVASEYLEDLKSTKWDNFTHKNIFVNAVEECLKFDGLMGKGPSSDSPDSHADRREMLHRRVVARLEWLNRSFQVIDKKMCYLSTKRVSSELALDSYCQVNGYPTLTTTKNLDQPSLNSQLAINPHLSFHDCSSTKGQPSINGSKYILSTVPKQPRKRKRPTRQGDFEIAIICALTIEADAIDALFDEHWDDDWSCYGKAAGDSNTYTTGSIGPHNVVLIHMPGMGKGSAASVAANCRGSFPGIKLAIVVGVCGTVPFVPGTDEEIVLGDVIVSDGIIQYDLGRRHPDRFERKDTLLDSLGRPNIEIRGILAKLKGIRSRKTLLSNMSSYLGELRKETELKAEYPGTQNDKLFGAACHHADGSMVCQMGECGDKPIFRRRLAQGAPQPAVHFGLIASGDTVMKSGEERDAISQRENVVGFEMEGAGVWDIFPCVVIKGACDYADNRKTKVFQRYAAATAASCAKAFLNHWVPSIRDQK